MNFDKGWSVLASIVTVALVTTVAVNGVGLSKVIAALGGFFTGSLKAAQGQ